MSNVFPTKRRLFPQSNAINRHPFAWFLFACVLLFIIFAILNSSKAHFKALVYVVFTAQNWQMFCILEINFNAAFNEFWLLFSIAGERTQLRCRFRGFRTVVYLLQSLQGLSDCPWAGTAGNAEHQQVTEKGAGQTRVTWRDIQSDLTVMNTCLLWKLSKTKANEKPASVCLKMWLIMSGRCSSPWQEGGN